MQSILSSSTSPARPSRSRTPTYTFKDGLSRNRLAASQVPQEEVSIVAGQIQVETLPPEVGQPSQVKFGWNQITNTAATE